VRGDLTRAGKFSKISTDINRRICSFDYSGTRDELKKQLEQLAKTNSHLEGWALKD
jgi:hypothetical protein